MRRILQDTPEGKVEPLAVLRWVRRKEESERHIEGMFRPVLVTSEKLVLQQRVLLAEPSEVGKIVSEWRDIPMEDE